MKDFAGTAGLVLGRFGNADGSAIALVAPSSGADDPSPFTDLGIWILQMLPYALTVSLFLMMVVMLWLKTRQFLVTSATRPFLGRAISSRGCSNQPVTSAQ